MQVVNQRLSISKAQASDGWREYLNEALKDQKILLSVLAQPSNGKRYFLGTYSDILQTGWLLSQDEIDKRMRSTRYCSGSANENQRAHDISERQCFGVV